MEYKIVRRVQLMEYGTVDYAIVSTTVPINRDFIDIETELSPETPRIDAVYIPSLGKRKHLLSCIASLEAHCKNIFVLLTGDIPEWLHGCVGNQVRVVDDSCTQGYGNRFIEGFARNPSWKIAKNYDLPAKRNWALAHSRENHFRTIGLIDDDIIFSARNLEQARQLLVDSYDMVGFYVLDYPDVATIDHLERYILLRPSRVSVNGNFLFFRVSKAIGFFPYVYNDDCIFILSNLANGLSIGAGGYVGQLHHEPWKDHQRIGFEQFGEVLLLGFKLQIGEGKDFLTADRKFWSRVYDSYVRDLEYLRDSTTNAVWQNALSAAIRFCSEFSYVELSDFVKYLKNGIKESKNV